MDVEAVAASLRRKQASRFELWKAIRKARLRERRQLLLEPPDSTPKTSKTMPSRGLSEAEFSKA